MMFYTYRKQGLWGLSYTWITSCAWNINSSISPAFVMTCLRCLGNSRDHPSMMESADWIISAESSLAAIFGEIEIANAAHLTALIK